MLPTDTVYGVGADAFTPWAVSRLLAAKGRGRDMPPPVLVGTVRAATALVDDIGPFGQDLIDEFWPGGLTLVCRSSPTLAWDLGDTRGTVAVRMPLHAVALDLLKRTGPMAVSSANRPVSPAATTADEAFDQLGDSIAVYLDGGPCGGGVASTIIDLTGSVPRLLRAGAIPHGPPPRGRGAGHRRGRRPPRPATAPPASPRAQTQPQKQSATLTWPASRARPPNPVCPPDIPSDSPADARADALSSAAGPDGPPVATAAETAGRSPVGAHPRPHDRPDPRRVQLPRPPMPLPRTVPSDVCLRRSRCRRSAGRTRARLRSHPPIPRMPDARKSAAERTTTRRTTARKPAAASDTPPAVSDPQPTASDTDPSGPA